MNRKTAYAIAMSAFIICFALILVGAYLGIDILVYLGIGLLFGGGLLFAVIGGIVLLLRARKQADEMDRQKDESNTNPEGRQKNRYSGAQSVFAFSIHGFRHAPTKMKILSILFLTLTLGSVFSGLICLFFKQFIAAYILFGCFALALFTGIAAAVIASYRNK